MVLAKRKWVSQARLVGLFEVWWQTPQHALLLEILNTWKEQGRE
jgi:hypothetical protein